MKEADEDAEHYYDKVTEADFNATKLRKRNLIEEGLDNGIITDEEYTAIIPDNKNQESSTVIYKCIKHLRRGK